jgi:hypothetical protein
VAGKLLRFIIFTLLFVFCITVNAQTTTITGTVTDQDGQAWNGGIISGTLQLAPNYSNLAAYSLNGVPLTLSQISFGPVTLSGIGTFSIAGVLDNLQVTPAGTSWVFTLTPLASSPAQSLPPVQVTGPSQSFTSYIGLRIRAPRFPASPTAYGYLDAEINPIPPPGGGYFNVTNLIGRVWNGSAWQNSGTISTLWNTISNPAGSLTLAMGTNTSTFNYTSGLVNAWLWANTTAATVGASQSSPALELFGTEWTAGPVSSAGGVRFQFVPNNGLNTGGTFVFSYQGSGTGAYGTTFPGSITAGSPVGGAGGGIVSPQGTANGAVAGSTACYADSTTGYMKCANGAGSYFPQVEGPASSTNNDLAAWSGTLGATLVDSGVSANSFTGPLTPLWLQFLGTGSDGSNTNASGNLSGDLYYTNFTVPFGNTVTVNSAVGLTVHATGTCTIAGTIQSRGQDFSNSHGYCGSASGGSGGGTLSGAVGNSSSLGALGSAGNGGTAGAASGGNGTNAFSTQTGTIQHPCQSNGIGLDGYGFSGAVGTTGGSSGGTGGNGGGGIILICSSVTGTDGTHTGVLDVSGANGNPPAANSTGAGSGGGGGVILVSSQALIGTQPSYYQAGGPGAVVTVPQALFADGSCTSPPKATLAVSAGALSGTCTVVQAGANCGTGTGVNIIVVGGGGTQGTATINPTYSGGALASCTITSGTSSGYTAATFTTSGTGGDGTAGWKAIYQGW